LSQNRRYGSKDKKHEKRVGDAAENAQNSAPGQRCGSDAAFFCSSDHGFLRASVHRIECYRERRCAQFDINPTFDGYSGILGFNFLQGHPEIGVLQCG
jgi:hypothetical protein